MNETPPPSSDTGNDDSRVSTEILTSTSHSPNHASCAESTAHTVAHAFRSALAVDAHAACLTGSDEGCEACPVLPTSHSSSDTELHDEVTHRGVASHAHPNTDHVSSVHTAQLVPAPIMTEAAVAHAAPDEQRTEHPLQRLRSPQQWRDARAGAAIQPAHAVPERRTSPATIPMRAEVSSSKLVLSASLSSGRGAEVSQDAALSHVSEKSIHGDAPMGTDRAGTSHGSYICSSNDRIYSAGGIVSSGTDPTSSPTLPSIARPGWDGQVGVVQLSNEALAQTGSTHDVLTKTTERGIAQACSAQSPPYAASSWSSHEGKDRVRHAPTDCCVASSEGYGSGGVEQVKGCGSTATAIVVYTPALHGAESEPVTSEEIVPDDGACELGAVALERVGGGLAGRNSPCVTQSSLAAQAYEDVRLLGECAYDEESNSVLVLSTAAMDEGGEVGREEQQSPADEEPPGGNEKSRRHARPVQSDLSCVVCQAGAPASTRTRATSAVPATLTKRRTRRRPVLMEDHPVFTEHRDLRSSCLVRRAAVADEGSSTGAKGNAYTAPRRGIHAEAHAVRSGHTSAGASSRKYVFAEAPYASEQDVLRSLNDWSDAREVVYAELLWAYARDETMEVMLHSSAPLHKQPCNSKKEHRYTTAMGGAHRIKQQQRDADAGAEMSAACVLKRSRTSSGRSSASRARVKRECVD